jgi:hypothetical protein
MLTALEPVYYRGAVASAGPRGLASPSCAGGPLTVVFLILRGGGAGSEAGKLPYPVKGTQEASRGPSRRSRRSRLRGAGAVTVQCMPVRAVVPPRLGLASFYGAVARSHPCPCPAPPGSCFRTLVEALGTFAGMRYHGCGLNAGASSHPCERPCRKRSTSDGQPKYDSAARLLQAAQQCGLVYRVGERRFSLWGCRLFLFVRRNVSDLLILGTSPTPYAASAGVKGMRCIPSPRRTPLCVLLDFVTQLCVVTP